MTDRLPTIQELRNRDAKIIVDNSVKLYIFTTIIDYLAMMEYMYGIKTVPYKDIDNWLMKGATYEYLWKVSAERTHLWIHEMIWLDLISFDSDKQQMSLTKHGKDMYQSQQLHIAFASSLSSKSSRRLSKVAIGISIVAIIISIVISILSTK